MNAMGAILVLAFAVVAVVSAQESSDRPAWDTKTEETIKKLEQEWVEAYRKRDTAFLERILADDYTFITPGGTVLDKQRQIDDLKSGAAASEFRFSDLKVRVYGDTAVVTGKSTVKGKLRDQDITGEYRFTRVFVKRGEHWQCVTAQATRITQP
jgi:ketosteroid isomerase-like protein